MSTLLAVLLFLLFFVLTFVIARFLSLLLHEFAHGITALILSRDKVSIYIGSLGTPTGSFTFSIGRLAFYITRDIRLWTTSITLPHSTTITRSNQFFITLAGPIASFIIGIVFPALAILNHMHGRIITLSMFISIIALFDFVMNLLPSKNSIVLQDGSVYFNDGQQLIQLIKYNILPQDYRIGMACYFKEDFQCTISTFQTIIDKGIHNRTLYLYIISSYAYLKDFNAAFTTQEEFEKHFRLNSIEYAFIGLIKSSNGYYLEGVEDFTKAIALSPKDYQAIGNRGYTYIQLEEYDKAIEDFNVLINDNPEDAYAFANRGLAKFKTGLEDKGLKDIYTALELDNNNAYAYKNLGIYYHSKSDYTKALELFEKAHEIAPGTHLIDFHLKQTHKKLHSNESNTSVND